jgi:hypothetical protein
MNCVFTSKSGRDGSLVRTSARKTVTRSKPASVTCLVSARGRCQASRVGSPSSQPGFDRRVGRLTPTSLCEPACPAFYPLVEVLVCLLLEMAHVAEGRAPITAPSL